MRLRVRHQRRHLSARRAAAALRGVIPVKANHHWLYKGYPEGHLPACLPVGKIMSALF
jgi:hypothetical protein